jgi:beta-lactam-binding protein with PASTA domain
MPTSTSSATSPSAPGIVVPNVVGQNFLEALVAVYTPFRLIAVRSRVSSEVPNRTILKQRPAAGTPVASAASEIRIRVVLSISPG